MSAMRNLVGDVFGRLTVIRFSHINRHKKAVWVCACSCGKETLGRTSTLTSGEKRSCGCLVRQSLYLAHQASTKHGMTGTPTYRSWRAMKGRCENVRHKDYPKYGARGISVCARWASFENFLEDMGPRIGNVSIDRINNALGYEKSNCRWATPSQQSQNQSTTKLNHAKATAIREDCRVQHVIAAEYGVSQSLVSHVKKGITWK